MSSEADAGEIGARLQRVLSLHEQRVLAYKRWDKCGTPPHVSHTARSWLRGN
jgi:hypothetical protein